MTELRFTRRIREHAPEPTPQFTQAMEQALERIAREEEHSSRRRLTRRQVVAVVVAALLILSMAVAVAWGRNVIDFFTMGNVTDSQRMIQKNLAHASFDHCDITIREAAYDGMSLYILYAVQDRDATECLGLPNPRTGERYMQEPYTPGMQADNVSWWIDGLWINGSEIDVPNMSVWNEFGTDTPGGNAVLPALAAGPAGHLSGRAGGNHPAPGQAPIPARSGPGRAGMDAPAGGRRDNLYPGCLHPG